MNNCASIVTSPSIAKTLEGAGPGGCSSSTHSHFTSGFTTR